MKKIFTLIAAAFISASVNAQELFMTNENGEETINAGTVLTDNSFFKATTVYNATGGSSKYTYTGGEAFTGWIQLRIDKDPSADAPNGTEKADCTPVIIEAKQDILLSAYVRTGNNKIVNLFDAETFTAVESTNVFTEDGSNNLWTWTWQIVGGKKYIMTERGGTGRLSGFTATVSSGIDSVKAENTNTTTFNLAGQKVNNNFKGIVIKNGKKFMMK